MAAGSPPASPHRLTGMSCSPAECRDRSRSAGAPPGSSPNSACATVILSRAAAITYCVRSFEPIEKKAASAKSFRRDRHRRHLDHDAERRHRMRHARPRRDCAPPRQTARRRARYSSGTAIIGNITFRLPCTAALSSARICTRKISGRASDRRMPRKPRNGLPSSTVKPAPACRRRRRWCGSSPACQRPIRAPCGRRGIASPRRAGRPLPNRNSVRIRPTPSQLAMSMRSTSGGIGDVDQHAHRHAVFVAAGFRTPSSRAAAPLAISCR